MPAFAPIPLQDPIGTSRGRGPKDTVRVYLPDAWVRYFTDLVTQVGNSPERIGYVALTGQTASIGATAIPVGTLSAGLYRVSYYARITTAAGTSSSLTITLDWTDGGVSCSKAGAAITGNTTATTQNATHFIRIDASSPIRYSTTYSSTGAPAMAHSLLLAVESVYS